MVSARMPTRQHGLQSEDVHSWGKARFLWSLEAPCRPLSHPYWYHISTSLDPKVSRISNYQTLDGTKLVKRTNDLLLPLHTKSTKSISSIHEYIGKVVKLYTSIFQIIPYWYVSCDTAQFSNSARSTALAALSTTNRTFSLWIYFQTTKVLNNSKYVCATFTASEVLHLFPFKSIIRGRAPAIAIAMDMDTDVAVVQLHVSWLQYSVDTCVLE